MNTINDGNIGWLIRLGLWNQAFILVAKADVESQADILSKHLELSNKIWARKIK